MNIATCGVKHFVYVKFYYFNVCVNLPRGTVHVATWHMRKRVWFPGNHIVKSLCIYSHTANEIATLCSSQLVS